MRSYALMLGIVLGGASPAFADEWLGQCYCNDSSCSLNLTMKASSPRDLAEQCANRSRGRGSIIRMARSEEPIKPFSCDIAYGFTIYKESNNEWELQYNGSTIYTFTPKELDGLYGGKDIKTVESRCGQSYTGNDYFAVKFGWNHDLLIAFGVAKNRQDRVISLQRINLYWRENNLEADMSKDLFLQAGNNHDLHGRYCWNSDGNGRWLQSTNLREAPS